MLRVFLVFKKKLKHKKVLNSTTHATPATSATHATPATRATHATHTTHPIHEPLTTNALNILTNPYTNALIPLTLSTSSTSSTSSTLYNIYIYMHQTCLTKGTTPIPRTIPRTPRTYLNLHNLQHIYIHTNRHTHTCINIHVAPTVRFDIYIYITHTYISL